VLRDSSSFVELNSNIVLCAINVGVLKDNVKWMTWILGHVELK